MRTHVQGSFEGNMDLLGDPTCDWNIKWPHLWLCGRFKLSTISFNDLALMMSSICAVHISLILRGPFTQPETFTGLCSLKHRRALLLFRCFMRSRLPAGYRRLCCQKWETLRNRTARWLRTDGRMTKKCRARSGVHSLVRHFFVILPPWVFQPFCRGRSLFAPYRRLLGLDFHSNSHQRQEQLSLSFTRNPGTSFKTFLNPYYLTW